MHPELNARTGSTIIDGWIGNERTSPTVASMCLIQFVRIEYVLVEIVVGKVIVSREYDSIVAMIQRS